MSDDTDRVRVPRPLPIAGCRGAAIAAWVPTVAMWLVSLVSYIDRNTLALLAPTIMHDTGLSGREYGLVISGFSIAYMIGNPLWGRILDRVGLRRGMGTAVSLWTAASASHALASGFAGFAAARIGLGFGEGATFPGGLRTVTQTLPVHLRGRGIAVAYSGGSLGAIVTPLIVMPVFVHWGWRGAFVFTGMVGAVWLALWAWVSRRPDVAHVPERPAAAHADGQPAPRLRDPRLWAFMLAYALGALPLGFVLYGAAIYMARVLGLTQATIGRLLWIPPLGWEIGYFVWGWLADRRIGLRNLKLAAALLSLLLAALPLTTRLPVVMAGLFVSMFAASGFIVLPMAYATRVFSPAHAGLIAGAGAGAWSAAVAVFMPLLGSLFDSARYQSAFVLAACSPVAAYLLWRLLDGTSRGASQYTDFLPD